MTDYIKTGGPAFPAPYHPMDGIDTTNPAGMTLRDYFAAKAMAALIVSDEVDELQTIEKYIEETAVGAYAYADAMLRARETS